jgi:hypothetical protein
MTISLQFVNVSSATAPNGQPHALSVVDQRAIRSQAMRDFRRRQRKAATTSFQSSQTAASTPIQFGASIPGHSDPGSETPEQGNTGTSLARSDSRGQSRPEGVQLFLNGPKVESLHVSRSVAPSVSQSPAKPLSCADKRYHGSLRTKEYFAQRTLPVPQTLRSPAMIRGPMLQSYIEAFYPSCIWSNPQMIGVLSKWSIARSQATLHINDAVGLTHMGLTSKDQQLVMEGRKRHVIAASSLRRELNDSTTPIEITSSAVISMMMAEMYSATSSDLAGCATHLAGVTAILHAHFSGPNARPVDEQVLRQYYRLILVQGLIHRKATSFHWRLAPSEDGYTPGSIEALIQLGLSLPGLMEFADNRTSPQYSGQVHAENSTSPIPLALDLGLKFDTWLLNYEKDGFRYRQAPLEFRSPVDGNVLGLYWSLRLLLAECIYLLNSSDAQANTREHAMRLAKSEASMYAALLVETAVVFQNLDGAILSKATGMRAPLHFAKQWWIRLADKSKTHAVEVMEYQLQADLPGIEWISLLYWSFMSASWLERI